MQYAPKIIAQSFLLQMIHVNTTIHVHSATLDCFLMLHAVSFFFFFESFSFFDTYRAIDRVN